MVVDDMASIPPRNRLSIRLHPNAWPAAEPRLIMAKMTMHAAMTGLSPMEITRLKLNSSPRVNMRNTTPMSAHTLTVSASLTEGV